MIYKLQYKSKTPLHNGNTYTRTVEAETEAAAWEYGVTHVRSGYRLIAVIAEGD